MALGVDLGTFASMVACKRGHRAQCLPLGNRAGDNGMSSAVFIGPDGRILAGDGACDQASQAHATGSGGRLVENVKLRLLDDSPPVQYDGRSYAADDLLRLLASQVRESTLDRRPDVCLSSCCFTIPLGFGTAQLGRFAQCLTHAGWPQPVFLEEPVAVILAWDETETLKSGLYLVVDIGHGSCDVALLRVEHAGADAREFSVLACAGTTAVSGAKISEALTAFLMQKPEFSYHDERRFLRIRSELDEEIRRARETLSTAPSASLVVDRYPNSEGSLDHTLTRESFAEALTRRDLPRRLTDLLEGVLEQADVDLADVSNLLLTGRPSHTPLMVGRVRAMFPRACLLQCKSPSRSKELVAEGAVLRASGHWAGTLHQVASRRVWVAGHTREALLDMGAKLPAHRVVRVPVRGGRSELLLQEQGIGEGVRDTMRIRLPDRIAQSSHEDVFMLGLTASMGEDLRLRVNLETNAGREA